MSFRSALAHVGFRRLWYAQVVSRVGDSIHEIALVWVVYELTGDPTLMAVVAVASLLPQVLTSLPAGVLVDRLNRRRLLVGSTVLRGVAVLFIPLAPRLGLAVVPVVVGVALVTGLMDAVFGPAKSAVIPNLVPESDLDAANSLVQLTTSVSKLLYVFGGVVIAVVGAFPAFYVDAVTFVVSAGVLATLPRSIRYADTDESASSLSTVVGEMREGLSFIADSRLLMSLLLLSVLTGFTLGPLGVVLPVFAGETLSAGSAAFGYLYGGIYVGVFVGGLAVNGLDGHTEEYRGEAIIAGIVGMGVALLGATLVPTVTPFPLLAGVGALVLFGGCLAVVQILVQTLAQRVVPDDTRGRVFGIWTAVGLAAPPLSIAISGPALSAFTPSLVLSAQGCIIVVAGVVLTRTPVFGRAGVSVDPQSGQGDTEAG